MTTLINHNSIFNKMHPKHCLTAIALFCCLFANAQVKKTTAIPVVNKTPATTTTPAATTPVKPVVKPDDGLVHYSSTKPICMVDPEFKNTPTYAKKQAKHPKTFDGTAHKDIKYPDGSVLHLAMVKNPSFAGQPTSINSHTVKGSEKKDVSKEWTCNTAMVTLTANSSNFLDGNYTTLAGHLYPGAIYTFNNFYNGSYLEQDGTRYPITYVNTSSSDQGYPSVVVKTPAMGTAQAALDKLIHGMKGPAANQDYTYQVEEVDNTAAQSLQISGGGSYDGFSASDAYSNSGSQNTVNLTIDATKILYTINLQQQDSDFFADQKIENIPNLMVIGSVSYGVRALANLSYTFSNSQEADEFKAAYSGMGAKVNFNLDQLSKSSSTSNTINCYVIGGPANVPLSFNKKDLQKQLDAIFKGATYQNAMPIAYTFIDVSGDVIGSNSATDAFPERNCVPNTPDYNDAKLKSISITYNTDDMQGDDKDNDTHYHVFFYPGLNISGVSANGYNGYINNPPQTQNNGESFIAGYETGTLNIYFPTNSTHTDQMTFNNYLSNVEQGFGKVTTQGYLEKNGGLIHFHIYPNGNDTWGIKSVVLTLNFDGGAPPQTITWGGSSPQLISLSQSSTEGTLYFGPGFKAQ